MQNKELCEINRDQFEGDNTLRKNIMSKFDTFVSKISTSKYGNTGWITHKGDVIIVKLFDHLKDARNFMLNKPSYAKISNWIETKYNELNEDEAEYLPICEKEGGGWHVYEMARDNLSYRGTKRLLDFGWIRIYFEASNSTLTVHGSSKGIKEHYSRVETLKAQIENEYWETHSSVTVKYENSDKLKY